MRVVSDGVAWAVVVVSAEADGQARHAVDVLVACVGRATGVTLPVVQAAAGDGRARLYVGWLPDGSDLRDGVLEDLPDDGFVIHQQGRTIAIVGSSSWGTRYGVYEFLERYVGVRWLMPDAWPGFPDLVGSDVPRTSDLTVTVPVTVTARPAFAERVVHPFPIPRHRGQPWDYPGEAEHSALPPMWLSWGRPNRVRHQIEFQHNLVRLLPPDKYGNPERPETYHPEFYPVFNGRTFIPSATDVVNWQPRFTAPGIAKTVAAEAIAQADSYGVSSVSLSVNDGDDRAVGFSDDEIDWEVRNSCGLPSASAAYYAFVREVAQLVHDERPDLTLGLLAYREVADPPDDPLPDNVVPVLTCDTYMWLDPARWARDDRWVQRWRRVASRICWWDYVYGRPHSVPRLYLRHMADAYRYLRDNSVIGVMAETKVALGEGPKMWIMSRLMWDPDQDVDQLLIEWCHRYVGERAAPYLVKYFRHWDEFWTDRVPGTEWFDMAHPVISAFRSAAYLELVTSDEIAQCRQWLEQARSLADTREQQVRMDAQLAHFEFYEASALSYPRRGARPVDAAGALARLTDATDSLDANIDFAAARLDMADNLYAGAITAWNPVSHTKVENHNLVWSGWNLYALWDVAQFIKDQEPDGGPIRRKLEELLRAESSNIQRFAQTALAIAGGRMTSVGANMSFEDPTLTPWSVPENSGIVPSTEIAANGSQSLFIPGGSSLTISQRVDAQPGFFRFSAKLHTPAVAAESQDLANPYAYYMELAVKVRDEIGGMIQQLERHFSISKAAGSWYEMVLTDMLIEHAHTAECHIIINTKPPIWVDDVSIVQW